MNTTSLSNTASTTAPLARYERVKEHIRTRILSGEWRPGDRIPSEMTLVGELGVSRMTINRAARTHGARRADALLGRGDIYRGRKTAVNAADDRAYRR